MRYGKYMFAQLKRMLKLAVGVFPTAMLLFVSLGIAGYYFFQSSIFTQNQNKFRIGIVGKIDETYLGFGISAVQTMDSSRFMVDFIPMKEDEARKKYQAGELTTYVMVPDEFLDSVVYGRNDVPITYVASEGQKGLGAFLMQELSKVVSRLVTSSQSSIYGMQRALVFEGRTERLDEITDEINLKLINFVLNRTKLAELEELGLSKGLLIRQYYFCTILLLFCFLFGIVSAPVFLRRNQQLAKWMRIRGIGAAGQVLGEYIPYFVFLFFCTALPLFLVGRATGGLAFLRWKLGVGELIRGLLPLTMMIAALHFMIYELFHNPVANLLFQFIVTMGMGYVSGFFLPAAFFPDGLIALGRILPTGVALDYLSGIMLGSGGKGWKLGAYLTAFLVVSILARARKIQREV